MDTFLFLGGNTCKGFCNFFDQLHRQARHTVIIKGGPGVGKSTLMRDVAKVLLQKGHKVSQYACSGDPDSLDAIYDEDTSFLMVDGTAPHILDPKYPGAKDGILNLGVCLNEKQLDMQQQEITTLTADISARYAQAYRYLAAAESVMQDAHAVYQKAVDPRHIRALRKELSLQIAHPTEGLGWDLFAQAITCKGTVQQMDAAMQGRQIISLDLPWGLDAHQLLEPLRQEALLNGWAHTVYRDPLNGERIAHLCIGQTLFTTAVMMDAPRYEIQIDKGILAQFAGRMSFDRAAYDLMLHQAYDALNEAKKLHDALERYYADAMDYEKLENIKQQFLASL